MNKELQKAQSKLTGVSEKNQLLCDMTKQSTMTIREYERAVAELRSAVASLSEENALLRDFAYNVDPGARSQHATRFSSSRNYFMPQT